MQTIPSNYKALVWSLTVLVGTLSSIEMQGQKFKFSMGMNLGGARLYHQTRFETTTLHNLYETVAITHPEGYEWEQFETDFELRETFSQLRFGFFVRAAHQNLPFLVIAEAMSSTSTYEKMAFSTTVGFGKEFYILDEEVQCSFLGGYKFVWDQGFGAATLVNSIGHKEARSLVATYFAPVRPLGSNFGNLFTLRGSFGKTIDKYLQWIVGVEAYGELDVTPRIKRESRMSHAGLNLFMRYNLSKKRRQTSMNSNPSRFF